MLRLGVLVSGDGSNLQALIDAIARREIRGEIAVVISNRPGVRALNRAAEAGIPAVCVSHREYASREAFDQRVVEELRARGVQWVVLAGFMRMLTSVLLDAFPHRVINLHPSLLPAFPGVDAGKQALDYGVRVTGCTVHLVSLEMDSGPIVAQTPVEVRDGDDEHSLMQRIHAAEHATLVAVVRALGEGRVEITPVAGSRGARVRMRPA